MQASRAVASFCCLHRLPVLSLPEQLLQVTLKGCAVTLHVNLEPKAVTVPSALCTAPDHLLCLELQHMARGSGACRNYCICCSPNLGSETCWASCTGSFNPAGEPQAGHLRQEDEALLQGLQHNTQRCDVRGWTMALGLGQRICKESSCHAERSRTSFGGRAKGADHLVLGIDKWWETTSCGQEKERRQLLETLSPAALSVMC